MMMLLAGGTGGAALQLRLTQGGRGGETVSEGGRGWRVVAASAGGRPGAATVALDDAHTHTHVRVRAHMRTQRLLM